MPTCVWSSNLPTDAVAVRAMSYAASACVLVFLTRGSITVLPTVLRLSFMARRWFWRFCFLFLSTRAFFSLRSKKRTPLNTGKKLFFQATDTATGVSIAWLRCQAYR